MDFNTQCQNAWSVQNITICRHLWEFTLCCWKHRLLPGFTESYSAGTAWILNRDHDKDRQMAPHTNLYKLVSEVGKLSSTFSVQSDSTSVGVEHRTTIRIQALVNHSQKLIQYILSTPLHLSGPTHLLLVF